MKIPLIAALVLTALGAPGARAQALDTTAVETSYKQLKDAEAAKDIDGIIKYAAQTSELARKVAGATAADDTAKKQVDYARQVDTYTEYSLFAAATQSTDPAATVKLYDALTAQNPASPYIPQGYSAYLAALQKTGQNEKAGKMAQQLSDDGKANEDVLLIAADYSMRAKNADKTLLYSGKLVDLLGAKPKPEGVDDAAWEKKKNTMLGVAYWMQGLTYADKGKYMEADKALRAGLPNFSTDDMKGKALYTLGMSDYQLAKSGKDKGKLKDALTYSQQAAAVKGPLQAKAAQNVKTIRAELGVK